MSELKAKKETKGKSGIGSFPWFVWLAIALVLAGIVAFVRIYPVNQPSSDNLGESKAAIVDQLHSLQPNETFISEVTRELEDYGFEVDIYQGDEVTVDLYGRLPGYGYGLIIFRAHSGLLGSEGEVIERTCLFTNEPYSQTRHVAQQLSDQLAMARIDEHHPWVFGIGDELIEREVTGLETDQFSGLECHLELLCRHPKHTEEFCVLPLKLRVHIALRNWGIASIEFLDDEGSGSRHFKGLVFDSQFKQASLGSSEQGADILPELRID